MLQMLQFIEDIYCLKKAKFFKSVHICILWEFSKFKPPSCFSRHFEKKVNFQYKSFIFYANMFKKIKKSQKIKRLYGRGSPQKTSMKKKLIESLLADTPHIFHFVNHAVSYLIYTVKKNQFRMP
jgi:hypothetical protein